MKDLNFEIISDNYGDKLDFTLNTIPRIGESIEILNFVSHKKSIKIITNIIHSNYIKIYVK